MFEHYHAAVRYLEGLSNIPGKKYEQERLSLEIYLRRMRYFLELLGNPDKGMKFIHITGTAGKGTVSYMVQNILSRAFGNAKPRTDPTRVGSGARVGLFNSPFVTTTIEKIRVDEQYIAPDEFAAIIDQIKPAIDKAYMEGPYGGPSYFEIIIAIALVYFKQKKCEWVVWEVGCGGRYDGTNVIHDPIVTAITNIDYDHMHILGKTLNKIAYEKAGIIKKGCHFFTTEHRQRLLRMFEGVCADVGAKFHSVKCSSSLRSGYKDVNKALVTAIAEHIGIDAQHIEAGIAETRLPCRFEIMEERPLVILDGAHSPIKIATTVANLKMQSYRKLVLVFGVADDKNQEKILEQIVPMADEIVITRFQLVERRCAHPKKLVELIARYKKSTARVMVKLDPLEALDAAKGIAQSDDCILATGSFFLTGEMRTRWYPEEWVLENRKSFR